MEDIRYTTMQALIDKLSPEAYAKLVVSTRQEESNVTSHNPSWRSLVGQLVHSSRELRDRNVDWRLLHNNLEKLLNQGGSAEEALIQASKSGMLNELSVLLEAGVDPSTRDNAALLAATEENRVDVVILLLSNPLVDPVARNNKAYKIANRDGFHQLVEILSSDKRVRSLLT